jgi:RNA polymerase sigma-70 factor (ECF subfamily)
LSAASQAVLEGSALPSAVRASEIKMDVMEVLQTLQPDYREVVVLREIEGLSYKEVAETLNVPAGTVESRLFRARQELKQLLKEYME